MKKRTLILAVDWLLIVTFAVIIASRFISLPFVNIVQPVFFIFILIHVLQHWRALAASLKRMKGKSNGSP
jgi:hypothetical protein